jgi:hypothetical protein
MMCGVTHPRPGGARNVPECLVAIMNGLALPLHNERLPEPFPAAQVLRAADVSSSRVRPVGGGRRYPCPHRSSPCPLSARAPQRSSRPSVSQCRQCRQAALLEAVAVGDLTPAEASELGKLIEAHEIRFRDGVPFWCAIGRKI